jgi:hypothetical protein
MELFIPILLLIALSISITFFAAPRFGPIVLGVVSALLLIAGGIHVSGVYNITLFQGEFVPSLLVILISAFIAFLVVPNLGPMILGITSLLAIVAVGIHHWSMFQSEYKLSTWQNAAAAYTPWVVLGLAVLAILGALLSFFTGASPTAIVTTPMEKIQEAVVNAANSMPPANTATNPVTASLNRSITTFKNI